MIKQKNIPEGCYQSEIVEGVSLYNKDTDNLKKNYDIMQRLSTDSTFSWKKYYRYSWSLTIMCYWELMSVNIWKP